MRTPIKNVQKENSISLSNLFLSMNRIENKIDRLNLKLNLEKDYLTTQEACAYLGCTRSMIWKLVNAGKLNKLKKENGRTYYATHELKKYVEDPNQEVDLTNENKD